jgi:hypothetical protein
MVWAENACAAAGAAASHQPPAEAITVNPIRATKRDMGVTPLEQPGYPRMISSTTRCGRNTAE